MTILVHHPAPVDHLTCRQPGMTVQMARVSVSAAGEPRWIDNHLEPLWRPTKAVWRGDGLISELHLRRILGAGPQQAAGQRPEAHVPAAGDRVLLKDDSGSEWFRGYITSIQVGIAAEPDAETLTAVASGPEMLLADRVVGGQWFQTPQAARMETLGTLEQADRTHERVLATDLPVIFNPAGRANASPLPWRLSQKSDTPAARVFVGAGRVHSDHAAPAEHWTAYTAIRSLIEWIDGYRVIAPQTDWARIEDLADQAPLEEVDVDGLDLLSALGAILGAVGLGFALEPWATDGRHRLVVYARGREAMRPRLADGSLRMSQPEARLTQVQRIQYSRDTSRVRNDVRVLGDQKRVQVELTFTSVPAERSLHPAWDRYEPYIASYINGITGNVAPRTWPTTDMETWLSRYHAQGGQAPGFPDSLRSFVWNEDLAHADMSFVEAPDLAAVSDQLVDSNGFWATRPRPLEGTFEQDGPADRRRFARAVLSIDGCPEASVQAPAHIWPDRCGMTLGIDAFFDVDPVGVWREYKPFAHLPEGSYLVDGVDRGEEIRRISYLDLIANTLLQSSGLRMKLSLIGSIEADVAVGGRASWTPGGPWPWPRQKQIRLPHRFAWRTLEGDPGEISYDLVDDWPRAKLLAERLARTSSATAVSTSMTLRYLTRSWRVGDGVASTQGRVIDLRVPTPDGPACQAVTGVEWLFGTENKTRLTLRPTRTER